MKKFFDPEPLIITTGGSGPGLFHDTIRNMKNAISLGSDVLRTNVSMTKDKRIILFSNIVFTNRQIAEKGIGSFTLDELKALCRESAGNDPQDDIEGLFPELEEALAKIKDHRFNLHLYEKDSDLARSFCDIIRIRDSEERVLVSSLSGYNLKIVRSVFPEIPTGFPFISTVGFYALYRTGLIYFKKKFMHDALITHEMIGASFLANAGLIKEAKSRGIRVYVLNVMNEDQVIRLREAGADGFVTNYASLVQRVLKNCGVKDDR